MFSSYPVIHAYNFAFMVVFLCQRWFGCCSGRTFLMLKLVVCEDFFTMFDILTKLLTFDYHAELDELGIVYLLLPFLIGNLLLESLFGTWRLFTSLLFAQICMLLVDEEFCRVGSLSELLLYPTLNTMHLQTLHQICPQGGNGTVTTNLYFTTLEAFDNNYFSNLLSNEGLLQSDKKLFPTTGANIVDIVNNFSANQSAFFENFVESMINMGNPSVLTRTDGEIRLNCIVVNGNSTTEDSLLMSSI
ncbi:uncharacterized protein LOC131179432 [Hevea brasiliensis]|uniref:uncharacterized protein LOC131179432 n=1 Tax=Hevea brasiliensis TaxID=3981 RepID=UPI0025E302A4|nr:uncharacterized protein LOC131179432 [Hevea brasiliensis]